MKKLIIFIYWKITYKLLLKFSLKNNFLFFESFLGKHFTGTPKYIYLEYIKEQEEKNMFYIISLKNKKEIQEYKLNNKNNKNIIIIKRMSLKYLYYIARSKYIINNSRMPLNFSKRKNQKYIQTWHGTPLKKLVYDVKDIKLPDITTTKYLENFSKDVNKWDLLISPNQYSTNIFKRCFNYDGEILTSGYPQIEELINAKEEKIFEIKNKLKIPLDHKIILYCPTFRDNKYMQKGKYIQDINFSLNRIKKELNTNKITLIIRNHYLVSTNNFKYKQEENIINLTAYENINDLMLASDLLITDYSSIFFEYLMLNKPIIFYQYDQEEYEDEIRGFYLDINELPGDIVKQEKELYKSIKNNFNEKYKNYQLFIEKYKLNHEYENVTQNIINKIEEL